MGVVDFAREPEPGWDFAVPARAMPRGVAIIGYRDAGGVGVDLRVAATAAVTVLIGFGDRELLVDDAAGQRTFGGFVVGLPVDAMRLRGESAACVEVRLSPARAYSLLGVSPVDLGRSAVAVEDLWGEHVRRLRERLASASAWDERFALTTSFLAQRDRPTRTPDPEVLDGWNRILTARGRVRVGELARSLGWSHKRLWSRFESQIGLTPKRAAMLVRFRHATDALLAGRPAAEVAAECGYTDQAHLCRDVAIFTDRTPRALTANHEPAIARHRYRAWGRFFQDGAVPLGR